MGVVITSHTVLFDYPGGIRSCDVTAAGRLDQFEVLNTLRRRHLDLLVAAPADRRGFLGKVTRQGHLAFNDATGAKHLTAAGAVELQQK